MKLEELNEIIKKRKVGKPSGSYVANLLEQGLDRIIQKVGEEAVEVIVAAKNTDKKRIIAESTDLLFHLMILFGEMGISMDDIYKELDLRRKE